LKNNKEQKINFSIIIPVFNSESFIQETVDSLIKQNYKNIEIIIINDCSTDNSSKIINRIKKKNKKFNFKIVNNKRNMGVAFSRNIGLNLAKGDYIVFLDSDDYLEKNSLSFISNKILENSYPDLVLGNHNMKVSGIFQNKTNYYKNELKHKLKLINNSKKFTGYCWAFIINRNFLFRNNIRFLNIKTHEDEVFVAKIISCCQNLIFINKKFYFHKSIPSSLSRKISSKMLLSCIIGLKELSNIYSNNKIVINEKKIFIQSRIKLLTEHMLPLIFLINKKHLLKYSKVIFLKKELFNKINKILKKKFFTFKNKNVFKQTNLSIQKKLFTQIKNKFNKNFYVFCMDKYGFAISKILRNKNYQVKGFLDNNNFYFGKKKFGIKHYSLKDIDFHNNIIICNQRKTHQKQIFEQLVQFGIKPNKIFVHKFSI
tara:strand:- start:2419 stop:3702 length:1284 start_codon:yes stop_codon:yes gene_type:complete